MLKLLIDAAVLSGIIASLRGDDTPDWFQLIFVALGMAVANYICALLLLPIIGLLVLVPIILIDGLILMFYCSLTIKQAAIALGILIVYNVLFHVFWTAIFH